MKNNFLFVVFVFVSTPLIYSQDQPGQESQRQEILSLIDAYANARKSNDSIMLKRILTTDIDQLVSSGKWRKGKRESMKGMLQSSANNPGTRTLKVEKIRFLSSNSAIADARYHINNENGKIRKMWSTFIVMYEEDRWKITAIRNMLPSRPQ